MKKLTIIAVLIFSFQHLMACCSGEWMSIAPKSDQISENPFILLDFDETGFRIYKKLAGATFHLINDKGEQTSLSVVERNKGFKSMAQILLQSTNKLKLGEQVSIEISGINVENEKEFRFIQRVQSKKWEVKIEKDEIAPKFNAAVLNTIRNDRMSSAPSISVKGKTAFWDNCTYNYIHGKSTKSQILVEAVNEQGKKYILIVEEGSFAIYHGMCGANFSIENDKKYTYQLRLIDFSGNKSKEMRTFSFVVPSGK